MKDDNNIDIEIKNKRIIVPVDFTTDWPILKQVKELMEIENNYGANTKAIKDALRFFIEEHKRIERRLNNEFGDYEKEYLKRRHYSFYSTMMRREENGVSICME